MSIARLHRVEKCRKSPGSCGKCSAVIQPGESYRWWTGGFRSRSKSLRCKNCPSPSDSQRESNSSYAILWDARDEFYAAVDDAKTNEELKSAAEDAASAVRDAISDWEDKKSNLENGFPNGCPAIEEIDEKIGEAESLADALESYEPDEDIGSEDQDEDEEEGDRIDSEGCRATWEDNFNL